MSKPDKNDGKRRRSSDGKTPRPSTKTVKMADNETGSSSGAGAGSGLVDKMTVIAEAVQELQKGQQSLQSMVETEPDGNRKENCVSIVDEFCEDYLGIRNISQDIERAHRIGRRRSGEFRPVVVKFSSFRIREKVRWNASRLGGTRFGIQEQFPRQIQEQRKQLYPILKDARKRGKRATLVVNKLYIDGVEYRGLETLDTSIRGTKDGDEGATHMEG